MSGSECAGLSEASNNILSNLLYILWENTQRHLILKVRLSLLCSVRPEPDDEERAHVHITFGDI